MFDRSKECKLSHKMMIRLNNFLYVFNLRQGTILIAVHQIALSSFLLIILLVGLFHVAEMFTMLQNDMKDDAERHGFYEVCGGQMSFHEGDGVSTNNQRRFAAAQDLATMSILLLYTGTVLTAIYLTSCVALLYGAVRYRREYVLQWAVVACVAAVIIVIAVIVGGTYPSVTNFFGGYVCYHLSCGLFVLTFVYAIAAVVSFAQELGGGPCARATRDRAADERGERLLLLDHAAHSSLLSAAQYNKLSHGTRTQFV